VDDAENPHDPLGCFWVFFRIGCTTASLYVIMFLAIFAAAILSLVFFR
jgi:hypothetical protein